MIVRRRCPALLTFGIVLALLLAGCNTPPAH